MDGPPGQGAGRGHQRHQIPGSPPLPCLPSLSPLLQLLDYVGGGVSLEMQLPKLLWLKTHRPQVPKSLTTAKSCRLFSCGRVQGHSTTFLIGWFTKLQVRRGGSREGKQNILYLIVKNINIFPLLLLLCQTERSPIQKWFGLHFLPRENLL